MEENIVSVQKVIPSAVNCLALFPKLAKLTLGLFRDARIPRYLKILTAGAILYVALPLDFLPDFVPTAGLLDDLIVILLILTQYMRSAPADVFQEHWDAQFGDEFDIKGELEAALKELEPQVGERFSWLKGLASRLIAKIGEFNARRSDEDSDQDSATPAVELPESV
jgi:uncharacterized membrane protein YkvA (DUF1232 family)